MVSYKFPVKRKKKVTEDYSVGQVKDIFIYRDRTIETEEGDKTKGYVFCLKVSVNFEFNDTTLSDKSKAQLSDIANLMKGNKNLKVKVIGHSDNMGTKKKNQDISEQCVQVAANYLIRLGIAKNKIIMKGKGDSEPLKSNDTKERRTINRRVEFEIYK